MGDPASYVQALASAGDGLSGNVRQQVLSASASAPAYLIESAEGIVTYSGFGSDGASKKARRWLAQRLASYSSKDVPEDQAEPGDGGA
ncbi:MAG TPA: hypothetical protein VNX67_07890 [Solirubrobacteraceae bacterium]|nr:hypothetical protein [Solirubrobacteraceae bacterium]